VLEAVSQVAQRVTLGDRDLSAAQLAELFGFRDDLLRMPVGDLSGGQRRRLQLLLLLATEPNVLLLDEPTNDLDTDTLAALEDLLDGWPGTLVVASHDRYLVERVTDTVYGMSGDGRLVHLPGGVDDYLRSADHEPGSLPGRSAAGPHDQPDRRPAPPAGRPGAAGRAARQARRTLARLERRADQLAERERWLHEQLAAHATDYPKVTELDTELRAALAERARIEQEWLVLADQLPDEP
jgi:ABC-type multidrug transport system ATPase subunit